MALGYAGVSFMEIKKDKNCLIIHHNLKKGEVYKISEGGKFTSLYVFKKPQIIHGVTSYCKDSGQHVLYIDYDDVPLWLVKEDFKRISEKYNLPPSYLITTHQEFKEDKTPFGNYHIISLKKFYANEITKILSETNADVNFTTMPIRKTWRSWVLRVGKKRGKGNPKFVEVLNSIPKGEVIISKAHKEFFDSYYYKINYPLNVKEDKNTSIFFQDYECT